MGDASDPRPDHRPSSRAYHDIRDEPFEYPDPRQKVQGPGRALMVAGWAGVAFSLFLAGLGVIITAEEATAPPRSRSEDILFVGVILAGCGSVSAIACAAAAIGGSRMRQCRGWGLAATGAILASASFLVLGLCSVIIMPFGVWALLVLAEPDVKREFERADRERWRAARAAGDDRA
jgi:hypothetical protein